MDQRENFVRACRRGDRSFTDLCRDFGISRKTGYKWEQRFLDGGLPNLVDRTSRPNHLARTTPGDLVHRVVEIRTSHPTWGPKKILAVLGRETHDVALPAPSTVAAILKRGGFIQERRRRLRTPQSTFPLAAATAPNIVWCTDFKGRFLVDRKPCYPLTISDAHSRFVFRCEPLESETMVLSKPVFIEAFKEFGLPLRLRSDNGRPFASTGIGGLSELSVWWIKLGILPERITPGCPQQNGRHERMHRTLKAEVASPPRREWTEQVEALEGWRTQFNELRPHEALDMKTPAACHHPSPRAYREDVGDPEYPEHFLVRRVKTTGAILMQDQSITLGTVLQRESVGVEPIEDGAWHLWFGPVLLGRLREIGRKKFQLRKEIPAP